MKHQPYSRRALGERFDTWAARNRRPILILGAVAVVALLAVTVPLVLGGVRTPSVWYALGLFHAVVVGGFMVVLYAVFLAGDGEAIHQVRGAWGEDNTREELRRAQRQGLIWGSVDGLPLEYGDLDHVVVTREGGVVAIDSKWRNQINGRDKDQLVEAARVVRRRAQGVVQTLLRSERGSHRARGGAVHVTPLVVVWGAAQRDLPDVVRTEGVEIVTGQGLIALLRELGGEPVNKAAATDLIRRLEDYREQVAGVTVGATR